MIMLPQTISGLTAAEQDLYRRLLRRLLEKRGRNRLRSKYYDGRNELKDIGYSLPPVAKDIEIVVGWPEKAVEALANRVVLDGVTMQDGSDLSSRVADLLDENDLRNTATSAHADALVHSCSFIAALSGDTSIGNLRRSSRSSVPTMRPASGTNAVTASAMRCWLMCPTTESPSRASSSWTMSIRS